MRLRNEPQSPNFKDNTNRITSPDYSEPVNPYKYFVPGEGGPPAILKTLTPRERQLIDDQGFSLQDIILMRAFKTNPGAVMKGWDLNPVMYDIPKG